MRSVLVAALTALIVSLLSTPAVVRLFRRRGYGQEIREDGPSSHATKRGTPTMGGTVIILATLIGYGVAHLVVVGQPGRGPTASGLLVLYLMTGLGLVGFLDDFIKIYKQRNLGLRSKAKMIGQTLIAVVFGILALSPWLEDFRGYSPASQHISFIRDWEWLTLPAVVVIVLIWVIITGTSNAVNLTDGLDGLAAGASMMVFGTYVVISFWQFRYNCTSYAVAGCYDVRDPLDLAVIAAAAMAGCIGFLWWNAAPAKIFMGDTGSLALGGLVAGLAIATRTELLMIVIGGLFVVEALSVALQVAVFRTSRRRLFRMAPFHHHFELAGWAETTVIIRFWLLAAMCAALGLGLFYQEWLTAAGGG